MSYSYKHILITGASSGIGAALAQHYASAGVILSLTGRNEARLQEVADACRAKGAQVNAKIVCVTCKEEMQEFCAVVENFAPIDLAIANAGISGGTAGNIFGESMDQVRAIFDVNVHGVFNTVEAVLPHMQQRKHGQIAIISSLAGFRGWPGAPAYCASKAAVKVYGEALRGALRHSGVKINVVCPGFVVSRMTDANDFAMPFLMDTPRAAEIIAEGLAANKGRICFPVRSAIIARILCALPDEWVTKFLTKLPTKGAAQ